MNNETQGHKAASNSAKIAFGADNFLRWSKSAMLRGGRVAKFKGITASFSPELGVVLPTPSAEAVGGRRPPLMSIARRLLQRSVAPIALLAIGSGIPSLAQAQDACLELSLGEFVCQDNGDPATDEQDLSGGGGDVTVTIEDGFEIDTTISGDDGVVVNAANSVVINQASGTSSIIGGGYGIDVSNIVNGIDITTGGDVTGLGNSGIYASNQASGDVSIDSSAGAVIGRNAGIDARNSGSGELSITTANVTGNGGNGINARQGASGLGVAIDSSAGSVTATQYGIAVFSQGAGDTVITTANVTANNGTDGNGITARQISDTSGAVSIDTTAGAVIGGVGGIYVSNDGSGGISITTANVQSVYGGEYGDGVEVNDRGEGDLIINTTAGEVSGYDNGISARNNGGGSVSITTADVSGVYRNGITANNDINGEDLSIDTAAGAVAGRDNGIEARNYGTGTTRITTAGVTSTDGNGILATNFEDDAGDLIIDSSAGDVVGGTNGIRAQNSGDGQNTVITTANVTGQAGDGIYARAPGETGSTEDILIDTTAGTVTGSDEGIDVGNFDSGDIQIVTADVEGTDGNGIYARNFGTGTGDLTIDSSAGAVTGGNIGVYAINDGAGSTSITAANVTGNDGDGINVFHQGADLTIDSSAGHVTGNRDGIDTRNFGSGALSITAADVTGTGADGINAQNQGTDLTINTVAGAVTGASDGIDLRNEGTGALSVTTADVTGSGYDGIFASNNGTDLTVDSSAGHVTGDRDGIDARNFGSGALSITTADVTATQFDGINARNQGTDLTINTVAGAVTGASDGIDLRNEGSGALSVTTADVTGSGYDGIFASNNGTDLTVDSSAGHVIGDLDGIDARNFGSGALSLTTADVTATQFDGIIARNQGTNAIIDTTAGPVVGAQDGIDLLNSGTGFTSITTADVTGSTGNGIDVTNEATATDLIIDSSAGSVTGLNVGIFVANDGTGSTAVTTQNVDGGYAGVGVLNGETTVDLTIDSSAGSVTGGFVGVGGVNAGTGVLSITTGDVEALGSFNIGVAGVNLGTDLIIDTSLGVVTGQGDGIYAINDGTGSTAVITADVTGTEGDGIYAYAGADSAGLTIDTTAGDVSGGVNGIYALNSGQGQNAQITTANVTGLSGNGIEFRDDGEAGLGADVSIDTAAGTVSGFSNGIRAVKFGTGDLSIVTADVIGTGGYGINAVNVGGGTGDLSIDSSAGAVTGILVGIQVNNGGSGATSIRTADVTSLDNGENGSGIYAHNDANATDLIIDTTAGTVTGADEGIVAIQNGTGDLSIVTGDVTGVNGNGIDASVYPLSAGSGDLIIDTSAGLVTGGSDGINAQVFGEGDLSVTTGAVTALDGDGIYARQDHYTGLSGDLIIDSSAGAVSGSENGIQAINLRGESLSITTADVAGDTGDGINALNQGTGNLTIDTAAGAVTGNNDGIFASNSGTGDTVITTADVTAVNGLGIQAINDGAAGDIIIDTTAGAVNSAGIGIYADNNASGSVSVVTGDVTSTTDSGIAVRDLANGDEVTINSVAGTVTADLFGILGANYGTGAMTITAADVVAGNIGITTLTSGDGGDHTIDSSAGSVSGVRYGIYAGNFGNGALSITTADVTGETLDGIKATNSATDLTIDSVAGAVSGDVRGIYAVNFGTGNTTITVADVTGSNNDGIFAANGSSATSLTINSAAGTVSGMVSGIDALNRGSGLTTIITADVSGSTGDGIDAYSGIDGAGLLIDSSAGNVSGGNNGIFARNYAQNAVITTADVTGLSGDGINVQDAGEGGNGADIAINTAAGTILGFDDGIEAQNFDTGDLSIVTADVIGTNSNGITAINSGLGTGDLTIDSTAGAVTGGLDGIFARSEASGDLSITTGNVTGGDIGVRAVNALDGELLVDTTGGIVTGGTHGIGAMQLDVGNLTLDVGVVTGETGVATMATTGTTLITLSSDAVVTGTIGSGIDASSTGGAITVQGSSGTVTGAGDGIIVNSAGSDILIDNIDLVQGAAGDGIDLVSEGGDINVTAVDRIVGAGGNGIFANAGAGNIGIAGNGSISGAEAGIAARAIGAGQIAIDVSGVTSGGAYGIDVSTEGGAVSLINSGTLTGGAFAVFVSADQTGTISLLNSGTVGGAISFAAADDSFDNRGLFMANGISDFGDGNDILVNTNIVSVADSAEFLQLEQFANAGLITLVNGAGGGTLVTSGDFVGNGGTLAVDIDFAGNSEDVFTISGAATGTTQIAPNPIGFNGTFAGDLVVVDAGAGTEAGAFVLASGQAAVTEFISFELAFDAAANDFLLGLAIAPRVFEANKLAEGAQSLWYRSADAWGDHRSNARFAEGETAPVWAVTYGAESNRDERFTDPTGIATGDAVLDYSQSFFGIQVGAEKRVSEVLTLGLTGGYLNSHLRVASSGTQATFDTLNIGASISVQSGGFFADALVKYDSIAGEVRDPAAGGFNGELDGSAFGGRLGLGYRTQGTGFYAEPKVSIEYQQTDLDSLVTAEQSFDFGQLDGLRGMAGIRLGSTSNLGVSPAIGFYLEGYAVQEFEGEGLTRFASALENAAFANNRIGTYARIAAGVSIEGEGRVSGFLKAETDVSSSYTSFGGSAGVRIRF